MEQKEQPVFGMSAEEARDLANKRVTFLISAGKVRAEKIKDRNFDRYLAGVPNQFRRAWLEAYCGDRSPTNAIGAKCRDCVGYEDTVSRIKDCTTKHCALWEYRPYQTKESAEQKQGI